VSRVSRSLKYRTTSFTVRKVPTAIISFITLYDSIPLALSILFTSYSLSRCTTDMSSLDAEIINHSGVSIGFGDVFPESIIKSYLVTRLSSVYAYLLRHR